MNLKRCKKCLGKGEIIFQRSRIIIGNGFKGIKCKRCGYTVKERSQLKTIEKWNESI